ncbi:MAG: RNA polymerase sigma factor [Bacteroidota bacterium]
MYADLTEKALWRAFQQGDTRALAQLIELHRPRQLRLMRKYVQAASLAEDLFQEATLRLLEKRSELACLDMRNFGAWLTQTVRQCWLAHQARERRRAQLLEENWLPYAPDRADAVAHEAADASHIMTAIAAVEHPLRQELLLSLVEGVSLEELAERYGRSPSWVYQNVYLARCELRKKLAA